MDPHPIIVHFPIALLTIYAIFELVRLQKVLEKPYWFYLKAVMAIAGEIFALLALMTGPEGYETKLVETHQLFAGLTVLIFGIIALGYVLEWFRPSKISLMVMRPYIIIPLALLGLISITITGGLGGAIVYGTQFDPFMAPIFKLLNIL